MGPEVPAYEVFNRKLANPKTTVLAFEPCPLQVPATGTVTMRRPLPVPLALYCAQLLE